MSRPEPYRDCQFSINYYGQKGSGGRRTLRRESAELLKSRTDRSFRSAGIESVVANPH